MTVKVLSKRQLLLLFVDVGIVLVSFYIAFVIRIGKTLKNFLSFHDLALVGSIVLAYIASFYIFEFYNIRFKFRSFKFIASIGGAFGLVFLLTILSFYIFPYELGRGVFLISWVFTGLLVYGWRLIYATLFKLAEPQRNVLILGDRATIEPIIAGLKDDPEFRLAAVFEKEHLKERLTRESAVDSRGTIEDFVEKNKINDIVVRMDATDSGDLESALVRLRLRGVGCYTVEAFYERLFEKLPVLILSDRWFLISSGFDKLGNRFYKAIKRAVDFAVAAAILLITLPLSAVIAALIPLTSKRPILFAQERLGIGKKPFKIIKFRTMTNDAEAAGPQWAHNNDGRVTKVGRVLRKTRLDEIPQLINVLTGEMSLIGPRPERKFFVDQLTNKIPFYAMRFFVKPGITGWAQVNFRYGSDEKDAIEKLRYELYYIKNQSLFLDFRIMMKTIRVVLFGMGT